MGISIFSTGFILLAPLQKKEDWKAASLWTISFNL